MQQLVVVIERVGVIDPVTVRGQVVVTGQVRAIEVVEAIGRAGLVAGQVGDIDQAVATDQAAGNITMMTMRKKFLDLLQSLEVF